MRALLSVSDKQGITELADGLRALGYTIISTGGTFAHLAQAGIECLDASAVTGFPEMLGGRVKTLHPYIFAGILARREGSQSAGDEAALAEHGIDHIDVVVVNLYPFVQAVAAAETAGNACQSDAGRSDAGMRTIIEQIDIGGPSLLRAAAKNHAWVYAVTEKSDYAGLLSVLRREREERGQEGEGAAKANAAAFRRRLAARVFQHTAAYDAAIAEWFASLERPGGDTGGATGDDNRAAAGSAASLPPALVISAAFQQELRYGENPHQRAALYRDPLPGSNPDAGVHDCEQLQGKELSYNNILDLSALLDLLAEFALEQENFCCILKHNNPCGAALASSQAAACARAWEGDEEAAFGGVVGFTRAVDAETARFLSERFVELIAAPAFSAEALSILESKKNLRLMRAAKPFISASAAAPHWKARRVRGGWLWQEEDTPGSGRERWSVASSRSPDESELDSLEFIWKIVKHVRSNAICIGAGRVLLGCGAGQMSRVDSVRCAVGKVTTRSPERIAALGPLVLASDAFFPFRDGVDIAAAAGVRAVIQPGGSVRDGEVRAACDEHDLAQVISGRRHFLH